MPIIVSDQNGGIISTDWLEDPEGIRTKVNIIIKSSNALKVKIFKQVKNEKGEWKSVKPTEDIKQHILIKAKELKSQDK